MFHRGITAFICNITSALVTVVNAACIYLVQVAPYIYVGRKSTKCGGLRLEKSSKDYKDDGICMCQVEATVLRNRCLRSEYNNSVVVRVPMCVKRDTLAIQ